MNSQPYASAAWKYREAGHLGVIPIGFPTRGSAAGPGRKFAPPTGYTGWAGINPSGADIQAWIESDAAGYNIGLHLPPDLYVPDFDHAGRKAELEAAAEVAFPATWTSTAHGPGAARHHAFYRAKLPDGRMWMDHPLPGMDSLHTGHRYAVVWPSVHPGGSTYEWYDPDGELYEGVPPVDDFAELPAELVMIMSKDGAVIEEQRRRGRGDPRAALACFRRGPACPG